MTTPALKKAAPGSDEAKRQAEEAAHVAQSQFDRALRELEEMNQGKPLEPAPYPSSDSSVALQPDDDSEDAEPEAKPAKQEAAK